MCCFPQARMAATIRGRISPARRWSTRRPSKSWPKARASADHSDPKVSTSTSPRSSFAHALVSGLVAFTVRMKSLGSPRSTSRWVNASNGLDEITPPKSNMTARITAGLPRIGVILAFDGWEPNVGR